MRDMSIKKIISIFFIGCLVSNNIMCMFFFKKTEEKRQLKNNIDTDQTEYLIVTLNKLFEKKYAYNRKKDPIHKCKWCNFDDFKEKKSDIRDQMKSKNIENIRDVFASSSEDLV